MKIIVEESAGNFNVNALYVPKDKVSDLLLDLRILIKNYAENE